jgi:hypothetical protein
MIDNTEFSSQYFKELILSEDDTAREVSRWMNDLEAYP